LRVSASRDDFAALAPVGAQATIPSTDGNSQNASLYNAKLSRDNALLLAPAGDGSRGHLQGWFLESARHCPGRKAIESSQPGFSRRGRLKIRTVRTRARRQYRQGRGQGIRWSNTRLPAARNRPNAATIIINRLLRSSRKALKFFSPCQNPLMDNGSGVYFAHRRQIEMHTNVQR